jgi:hypothetical protein
MWPPLVWAAAHRRKRLRVLPYQLYVVAGLLPLQPTPDLPSKGLDPPQGPKVT